MGILDRWTHNAAVKKMNALRFYDGREEIQPSPFNLAPPRAVKQLYDFYEACGLAMPQDKEKSVIWLNYDLRPIWKSHKEAGTMLLSDSYKENAAKLTEQACLLLPNLKKTEVIMIWIHYESDATLRKILTSLPKNIGRIDVFGPLVAGKALFAEKSNITAQALDDLDLRHLSRVQTIDIVAKEQFANFALKNYRGPRVEYMFEPK